MKPEDMIGCIFLGSLVMTVVFVAWEVFSKKGRAFPRTRGWAFFGVASFFVSSFVSKLPLKIAPEEWIARHRLFDGTSLGIAGGTVVGVLAATFVMFVWHRAQHRVPFLWRTFHQLHHSPSRVDLAGTFIHHPFEMFSNAALMTFVNLFVLGLHPVSVMAVAMTLALLSMFSHLNVRTPRWMGYLVERPEAHCLHHEKGVHARNFSELPLWDMMFGTYANPETFSGEVGFDDGARTRVGAMLLTVDVNRELTPGPKSAPVVVAHGSLPPPAHG